MFKITLNVDGMSCGMCEAHVNDTVRKLGGIKKVSSSRKKKTTEIISEREITEPELTKAIGEMGYTVTGYTAEPYEKKGLFSRK